MTFEKFQNALRVLLNIDFGEFEDVLTPVLIRGDYAPVDMWRTFDANPWLWFIGAPDHIARAIWKTIEERSQ